MVLIMANETKKGYYIWLSMESKPYVLYSTKYQSKGKKTYWIGTNYNSNTSTGSSKQHYPGTHMKLALDNWINLITRLEFDISVNII